MKGLQPKLKPSEVGSWVVKIMAAVFLLACPYWVRNPQNLKIWLPGV